MLRRNIVLLFRKADQIPSGLSAHSLTHQQEPSTRKRSKTSITSPPVSPLPKLATIVQRDDKLSPLPLTAREATKHDKIPESLELSPNITPALSPLLTEKQKI